jgi:hypothetical protein
VNRSLVKDLRPVFSWLVFPLVPVVLEDVYYGTWNLNQSSVGSFGADPRQWDLSLWFIMTGPLVGYGFLAGATVDLPDDPGTPRRRWRRLLARRSVLVAIAPWSGFLLLGALFLAYVWLLAGLLPPQSLALPESWKGTWLETVMGWIFTVLGVGILAYAWLWPATAVLVRSARLGRFGRTLARGLAVALAFVGSLFGGFWAATAFWRSYFFDSRVVPVAIVVLCLAGTSGCGGTITYGELRRRELFHAMLMAWVLGLALLWRWWSRPRKPQNGTPT